MSFLPGKKQKHSGEGSSSTDFREWWTERYGKITKGNIALCALCSETVLCRTSSVKGHYKRNHKFLHEKSEKQKELIS
jgi:hypothetical protein